ncbi:PH domain-containing protein [Candidatus Saccharibacteria bacterium]|nr:PH domain-containing protein [Candidatus Saccharibacteria bacterium]MCA9328285.1 PH domain-containing protein [Candidatus Saccharibacteria bacterium]
MHPRPTTIETVDADEVKLAEVFKHPIGIILLYIQAAVGMVVAIGMAYFLLPIVLEDTDTAFFIGNVFAAVSVVLAFLVILIASFIYRQNRIIITDRNITQILQYGLFNRKVSQLNMHNVEDVTAVQNGVLPTMLNYGTLKVETAGEQVNFVFPFCPEVGKYAKIILDSREKVLGQMNHEDLVARHGSNTAPAAKTPQKSTVAAIKDLGAETVKQANTR